MKISFASYSKAQMKIQQMAFMLVAIAIFFAMAGLIYLAVSLTGIQNKAQEYMEAEAKYTVMKLTGSPELAFTSSTGCSSCIDLDKALVLKENPTYKNFWNLNYLMIEKIYPVSSSQPLECTKTNYPDCSQITLIDDSGALATKTAIVSLAHWDSSKGSVVYELGRIHASARQ